MKFFAIFILSLTYVIIVPTLTRNLWILSKTSSDITFSFVTFMCCWLVCGIVGGIHSFTVLYAIVFQQNGKFKFVCFPIRRRNTKI